MSFDLRKKEARELVVLFLRDYTPPRGMGDETQARRIDAVADAFARRMPADDKFAEKVDAVLMKIRDTHLSNTWPSQAVFVMAMPQTEYRGSAPQTYKSEDPQRIARMMAQGLSVPEVEIWKSHDVSRDVLDRYRFAAVDNWRSCYGPEARKLMAQKYGGQVHAYFQDSVAAQ